MSVLKGPVCKIQQHLFIGKPLILMADSTSKQFMKF